MTHQVAVTLALYAVGLGVWALLVALAGRPRSPYLSASLVALEVGTVLQTALAAVALAGGQGPPERAVHIGYLVASVAILPIVLSASAPGAEKGRWDNAGAAVGCLAVAVVALRVDATAG